MAHYIVGDIQGCFDELQALLEIIHFDMQNDELWLVGDLVNRGPKSLEVLRFLKALPPSSCKIVLGNHDTHLLAVECGAAPLKPHDTFEDVLNAPDCTELCYWLRQQPLIHYDAEIDCLMVHAGILPIWTTQQAIHYAAEVQHALQSKQYVEILKGLYGNIPDQWDEKLKGIDRLRFINNCLTRMRLCSASSQLDLIDKGPPQWDRTDYQPWFTIEPRISYPTLIVFGHWAALGGETHRPDIIALDTGCAWGNSLTAMRLEDGQRFQVPSLRTELSPRKWIAAPCKKPHGSQ